MTHTKWSDDAWQAALAIYNKILELPFLSELGTGTLPREKFIFYISQDALYLGPYASVLAHAASRMSDGGHAEDFLRFALNGMAVERALHGSYLEGIQAQRRMSPTCLLYTSLLKAQAYEPVEVETAAVLPCFLVYQRVGEEMLRRVRLDGNPYARWIETYGDTVFAESTRRATEICDEMAEKASPEIRKAMTEIFVECARMEWMFWNSAYNLEEWKI